MVSVRLNAAELARCRRALIARAAFERAAMREATEDLQIAGDRIARMVVVGIDLMRRFWLPVGLLVAVTLVKRARPLLRYARTGLAIWQTVQLMRGARR
ncbi:MAG: hypothetical protein R3D05_16910 [Dongiaceae bacterium]